MRHSLTILAMCLIAVTVAALSGLVPSVLEISGPGSVSDTDTPQLTVYVSLSPDCPISNTMIAHLNELHERFGESVTLIGLVPESCAPTYGLHQYLRKYNVRFAVQIDSANTQCRQLGLSRTPESVLCDANGRVLYRGRVDDRFVRIASAARPVTDQTLLHAVETALDGRLPSTTATPAVGCLIPTLRTTGASGAVSFRPTFASGAGQLIYEHCACCHRPGESAPFSLLSYDDVRRHSDQVLEVVERRLMPPWKPARDFGQFRNEHRLSSGQIRLLADWIRDGMPRGPKQLQPEVPDFPQGWQHGEPDIVLTMPEPFTIPADGPDIYQHFVIPTGLLQNRLIRAVEFRAGQAEVVHHAFMYFDTTGTARRLDAATPEPGYERLGSPGFRVSGTLGGWGPGGTVIPLPDGMGRPLPAGADLVLQVHYHPTGRVLRDRSRVGLYFAEEGASRLVTEILVANTRLNIPAGAREHHHPAEWTLPVDVMMLDATPHMHTLGRRIQAEAIRPDGRREPLIRIHDWDFYWQDTYAWQDPIILEKGTRIRLDCWFDNSIGNVLNPNTPPRDVQWGDNSSDEMGVCYFRVTTRTLADYRTLNHAVTKYFDSIDPGPNARE